MKIIKYIIIGIIYLMGIGFLMFIPIIILAPHPAEYIDEGNHMIKESNKIPYSSIQLPIIKAKIQEVDSIFQVIHHRTNRPLYELGFAAYGGDSVYYRHCLASDGQHFIKSNECNFEQVLGEAGNNQLSASIDSLRSKGIRGVLYVGTIDSFLCMLDVSYKRFGDNRYLFVNRTGIDMSDHLIPYEVIEKREEIYLLKNKP